MTKMAAKPIYGDGKNTLKIFFHGTCGPISIELGMKHRRLKSVMVCSNENPGLTLTHFTARSNFAT